MTNLAIDPAPLRTLRGDVGAEAALHPPPLRDGLIGRTALVNRLRTEQEPVVLLTAPGGYGKTTLLAQWAQRDPRPFAWAGLRPGANDVASLLRTVVAAIDRVADLDEQVTAPVDRRASAVHAGARRLAKFMYANTTPLVVVVDGLDQIESPGALELLDLLCDHAGAATRVVLSGRMLPSALRARLRTEGRAAEFERRDLELTGREARTILRNEGVDVDDDAAAELSRRAEGWVTGIYLSARSLKTAHGRTQRDPASADGAHRFIGEYFETEVLGRLSPEETSFVTDLALLDDFAGPVSDAVLGKSGSGAKLRRLEAAGAFLVPLDREHTGYRFHHYLRDTLRRMLQQEEPARYKELSRRAAEWYVSVGDRDRAIRYLLSIGDRREAATQLGETLPEVVSRGPLPMIESALADLDNDKLLLDDQPAAIAGAFAHALLGHPRDAARWSALVERATPLGPQADGTASSDAWASLLRASLCQSGVERMRDDASAAAAQIDRQSPLAALAQLLIGVSHVAEGHPNDALPALTDASALADANSAPLVGAMAFAELSLIAQGAEEWTLGENFARKACDLADELDAAGSATAALAYVASVRSALRNSNWVRARDHTARVHALLPMCTGAMPWLAVQVRLELAHAHLALNDVAVSRELLAEVDRLALAHPELGTLPDEALRLREEIARLPAGAAGLRGSLTAAELRLLPLLTTHLTFRQIAEHLYVSRNTIKTQAISVYRKLGASSRTEAIDRAIEVGLLRPEAEIVDRPA
jgi:LuxR family maltose regulon positive regulatory protein